MEPLLLAIDVGTSACKTVLFSPRGEVLAEHAAAYPTLYPHPGWAEQNPEEWWRAAQEGIHQVLEKSQAKPGAIAGIGVDGQSWAAVALDKKGEVLGDTPLWMDTRSEKLCQELLQRYGEDAFFSVSGNALHPSYTLPKILWYQRECPQRFEKTKSILQSNSYIVYQLTGKVTQDTSQGYGLHCFSMKDGVWDTGLCRQLGISESILPPLYSSHEVVGGLTETAASLTGLLQGTPVVAGGLDAACASLGAGVYRSGDTQEQGGQAGGMSICTDTLVADSRLIVSQHVVPGHWLLQGGTVGGGGVMEWLARELGEPERTQAQAENGSTFQRLDLLAEAIPAGSEGVLFLPYMAGERSPLWNPYAKGVFYGLDFTKTKGHLVRAALEGVAYSLEHNLQVAYQAGATVDTLRSMGGAANSWLWTQMKADITGKTIEVTGTDTATPLGAAILAGVGVGVYDSFSQGVKATVNITRTHTPNPKAYKVYQQGFKAYLRLSQQLQPLMEETKP